LLCHYNRIPAYHSEADSEVLWVTWIR